MVVVRFSLEIEGKLESEFLNIMSSKLAKHLLEPFEISFQQAEQYQMEEDARKMNIRILHPGRTAILY